MGGWGWELRPRIQRLTRSWPCISHPHAPDRAQSSELLQLRDKVSGSFQEVALLRQRLAAQEGDVESLVASLARVTEAFSRLQEEREGKGGAKGEGFGGSWSGGSSSMGMSRSNGGGGGVLLASSEDPLHAILTRGQERHQRGPTATASSATASAAASASSVATQEGGGQGSAAIVGACAGQGRVRMCVYRQLPKPNNNTHKHSGPAARPAAGARGAQGPAGRGSEVDGHCGDAVQDDRRAGGAQRRAGAAAAGCRRHCTPVMSRILPRALQHPLFGCLMGV